MGGRGTDVWRAGRGEGARRGEGEEGGCEGPLGVGQDREGGHQGKGRGEPGWDGVVRPEKGGYGGGGGV